MQYESISEAAKRTGVHPNTIRNRIATGALTAYRFGPRLIKLDPAQVDALMRPLDDRGASRGATTGNVA